MMPTTSVMRFFPFSGMVMFRFMSRAYCSSLFVRIITQIMEMAGDVDQLPEEFGLITPFIDVYYGNFSLFQSLPDSWAINQFFPVMPIHRLDEEPTTKAIIADITCDCDGRIDNFIINGEQSKPHPFARAQR